MCERTITWVDATKDLPDSDLNVLIAVSDISNDGEVWIGYHDGERWRSSDGGMVGVSHWAELPESPDE